MCPSLISLFEKKQDPKEGFRGERTSVPIRTAQKLSRHSRAFFLYIHPVSSPHCYHNCPITHVSHLKIHLRLQAGGETFTAQAGRLCPASIVNTHYENAGSARNQITPIQTISTEKNPTGFQQQAVLQTK